MEPPLVSVVVATYGHPQYLPAALDAILHQDYPRIELVVVEDASPDDTREVLAEWLGAVRHDQADYASFYDEAGDTVLRTAHPRYPQDREIRVIHNDRNLGATEAYNVGYRAATGAYVTNVADDDLPHPSMMSTLVQALEGGFDLAYADLWVVDDAMRILRAFRFPDYDPRRCLADWYLLGVAKLYRREIHERCGYYDPRYRVAQDYDLLLRFAMAGARFVHVPQVLYSHRFHGEGRRTGLHAPEGERRMFEESKEIARRARAWLAGG